MAEENDERERAGSNQNEDEKHAAAWAEEESVQARSEQGKELEAVRMVAANKTECKSSGAGNQARWMAQQAGMKHTPQDTVPVAVVLAAQEDELRNPLGLQGLRHKAADDTAAMDRLDHIQLGSAQQAGNEHKEPGIEGSAEDMEVQAAVADKELCHGSETKGEEAAAEEEAVVHIW